MVEKVITNENKEIENVKIETAKIGGILITFTFTLLVTSCYAIGGVSLVVAILFIMLLLGVIAGVVTRSRHPFIAITLATTLGGSVALIPITFSEFIKELGKEIGDNHLVEAGEDWKNTMYIVTPLFFPFGLLGLVVGLSIMFSPYVKDFIKSRNQSKENGDK